jgi:hypothetical protein
MEVVAVGGGVELSVGSLLPPMLHASVTIKIAHMPKTTKSMSIRRRMITSVILKNTAINWCELY